MARSIAAKLTAAAGHRIAVRVVDEEDPTEVPYDRIIYATESAEDLQQRASNNAVANKRQKLSAAPPQPVYRSLGAPPPPSAPPALGRGASRRR